MDDKVKSKSKMTTQQLVTCAMLSAAAFILVFASHYLMPPMLPAAPFLKYDPKDIVLAIGSMILGPVAAVAMSVLVSIIEMITVSTTGWIGAVMNIISTCAFVLPASLLYRRRRSFSSAVWGLAAGAVLMTALMLLWNYWLTPIYMGLPRDAVGDMLLPVFLPFNAIKSFLNMGITILLYKPVVTGLRKARLLPASSTSSGKKITPVSLTLALAIIAACVAVILVLNR